MKRIPYGLSNFKKLITENYYYVDKTKFIEVLENFNEQYLIFLRPRRFGKSLFISLLEHYYDKRWSDEPLFDDFYIGKNPTPLKGSYYVLTFSFAGINTDTEENTKSGFNSNVRNGIKQFIYNNNLSLDIDFSLNASEMIYELFSEFSKEVSSKIYILIDEYDHFANELLGFNYEFFRSSVSKNGFVRKFYEQIKEGTRTGIVDRLFITGVTSITLDSMTSGFNIGKNITTNPVFNEMVGFTEDEVLQLASKTIEGVFDIQKSIEKLRSYYDGYKFHRTGKFDIYNSDMILYYMSCVQQTHEEPDDMVDRNVVSDYGKIEALFNIGGSDSKRMEILKDLIKGDDIFVTVSDKFNIEHSFKTDDFKSLLFYMGFITIKRVGDYGEIFMNVPNYVIKEIYFDYFQVLIERETDYEIDNSNVREAIIQIAANGKPDKLIKLTEDTLKRLSNRDFIRFDEKYVKVIMLNFLFKSKVFYTKSEYEVDDGYIDLVLLKGNIGTPKYYGCFEVKYIAKKDYSEKLVAEKFDEAKSQLMRYEKSEELKSLPNFKKFAVVFCCDECVKVEEV